MTFKITAAAALAAVTLAVATLGATGSAQAGYWHHRHGGALAAGVATGLVVGGLVAASAANAHAYDRYRRDCVLEDRFDRWGNYLRTVRVCRTVRY